MKLVTFTHGGTTRIGAVVAEEVVDFSAHGRDLPRDMLTFLTQGQPALDQARADVLAGLGRLNVSRQRGEIAMRSLRANSLLDVGRSLTAMVPVARTK